MADAGVSICSKEVDVSSLVSCSLALLTQAFFNVYHITATHNVESESINIERHQHISAVHKSKSEGEIAQSDKKKTASAEQEALYSDAEQNAAAIEYSLTSSSDWLL